MSPAERSTARSGPAADGPAAVRLVRRETGGDAIARSLLLLNARVERRAATAPARNGRLEWSGRGCRRSTPRCARTREDRSASRGGDESGRPRRRLPSTSRRAPRVAPRVSSFPSSPSIPSAPPSPPSPPPPSHLVSSPLASFAANALHPGRASPPLPFDPEASTRYLASRESPRRSQGHEDFGPDAWTRFLASRELPLRSKRR